MKKILTYNKQFAIQFKLFVLFSFLSCLQVQAQESLAKMEAVFMYNFTKNINWTSSGNKFVIGVIGKNDVLQELQKNLVGKKVKGKDIEVKSIDKSQVTICQMVYLSSTNSKDLENIIAQITGKNILLVAQDDLAEKGAGISFYKQSGKLKFKLNTSYFKTAGLQTSDNLLSFATVI